MKMLSAILVLLLHVAVLVPFFVTPVEHQEERKELKQQDRDLHIVEATIHSEEGENGNGGGDKNCSADEDFYFGIGMVHMPFTGEVIEVPESYPAFKAGIRQGDKVVDFYNLPGGDGIIHVTFQRGQVQKSLRIRKEKICFKKK